MPFKGKDTTDEAYNQQVQDWLDKNCKGSAHMGRPAPHR